MGGHRSRRVGQAIEFADYQEYLPGMDLRGLDWRVWGRSDRYVVKRFETETELPCSVVLDLSGDTATGRSATASYPDLDKSKAGYALTLAATLLYWLHRHGEPVGLEVVGGEGMSFRSLPCRGGRNHLQLCFLMLASAQAGGVADLPNALRTVGERIRRRSWVAVITDGMEEPDTWMPSLSAFAKRGADVRFLHLFDPAEFALEEDRAVLFYSPEGGEALAVDPVGAREAFGEVVDEFVEEVRGGVIRFGGRYIPASTGEPIDGVLRQAIAVDR